MSISSIRPSITTRDPYRFADAQERIPTDRFISLVPKFLATNEHLHSDLYPQRKSFSEEYVALLKRFNLAHLCRTVRCSLSFVAR